VTLNNPKTDVEIVATLTEIRVTGLESDLNLLLPRLAECFVVSSMSKWFPNRDNARRFSVYLTVSGVRKENGNEVL